MDWLHGNNFGTPDYGDAEIIAAYGLETGSSRNGTSPGRATLHWGRSGDFQIPSRLPTVTGIP
jgi:hypothetical protein